MSGPDRIVRRLRLRATTEAQVRAAVLGLEDALRCASLPNVGERLLLVRRLDLGRLPVGLGPQSLSRLIEHRFREVGGYWVHGSQDAAAGADTVFFASRLEAAQIALRRRSAGLGLAAWYWPRALPGVAVGAPESDFLRQLVDCLGREPSAPATLPALLADAVGHGALAWVLRYATNDTIDQLLALTGAQRHLDPSIQRVTRDEASTVAVGTSPASLGDSDMPPWLICALRTTRSSPSSVGGSSVPAWLIGVLRTARTSLPRDLVAAPLWSVSVPSVIEGAKPPSMAALPTLTRTETDRDASDPPPPASPPWPPGQSTSEPRAHSPLLARAQSLRAPEDRRDWASLTGKEAWPTFEGYPPLEQPAFDASLPTRAGGLLFLVNVLRRLGFPAWQQWNTEAPLCGAILEEALRRLQIEEEDPAWAQLSSLAAPESPEPRLWETPPVWADPRIRLTHAQDLALSPSEMAVRWLMACRRFLRRVARLGLASLCLRPARLEWTVTHADATLPIAQTDLRIRREGLDIDPGWQDWIGRVVSFHYSDGRGP